MTDSIPEMCRWIRATLPLLEILAEHEPHRRTREHAANGRAILARVDSEAETQNEGEHGGR